MKKYKYTATTPDGMDTATRISKCEYKFATWVKFPKNDHQIIVGFSKNSKPVLQGGACWKHEGFSHGVVKAEVEELS